MTTAKEHYENHLADIYSWMAGDFLSKQNEFASILSALKIAPETSRKAIDLGAGHGIQSITLAKLGFEVTAIDFSEVLLKELTERAIGLTIHPVKGDIRLLLPYKQLNPELIVCCGDTLTHLDSVEEVSCLLRDSANILEQGGKLLLSFRDYSIPLTGNQRFIPVKSDAEKILTCCLDYDETHVLVTDLLHIRIEGEWQQKVSSYKKVRLNPALITNLLTQYGMRVTHHETISRMVTIAACKNQVT